MRRLGAWALVCVGLLAVACAPAPPKPTPPVAPAETAFVRLAPDAARAACAAMDPRGQGLVSWTALAPALEESMGYLAEHPGDALALERKELRLTWGEMARGASLLAALLPALDANPALVADHFDIWAMTPDPLATGYYLPAIEASLIPDPAYPYPLYARPADLFSLDLGAFHPRWKGQQLIYRVQNGKAVPYHDRTAIDFHAALGRNATVVAWAKSRYDVNDIQTQGSGILHLPDGGRVRIGYDGKNGREFKGLWGVMRDTGHAPAEGMTHETVKAAIDANPLLAEDMLSRNPSYVFFRLLDGPALGAMGRPLMDRVSVAVDPSLVPLGSLLLLQGTLPPYGENDAAPPLSGLALAQDTGGAIKNRRLDFFWGEGDRAQYAAFRTKTPLALYLLVPKR